MFILTACASSDVSRNVSSNVDMGVQNAKNLADNATSGDLAESYQNTSQSTKGALVGGGIGALTGALYPTAAMFPFAVTGALLGASYGSYIEANATLQDKLINRGATIVVLGDQILVAIPSDRIFQPATATIIPQSYVTLDLLAQYINSYQKMLVKVAVYTDATGSERVDLALSQQQAQSIAKYLTADGVDARILYAIGKGGVNLVQKNTLEWSGNDNYRIEITMEKLHV